MAESTSLPVPSSPSREKNYVTHKGLNAKNLLRNSPMEERARSACSAFRSRFLTPRGRGRRPKLAFIGWKVPWGGGGICLISAPIIDSSGNSGGLFPAVRAMAETDAQTPE